MGIKTVLNYGGSSLRRVR